MAESPHNGKAVPRRRLLTVTVVVALAAVAYGLVARHNAFAAVQRRSAEAAVLSVATTTASRGGGGVLVLPGTLETDNETGLYARVQGFVRKLHVDIGQSVTAGQLLAEIDTPELDEQIRQAEADLANSRAAEELARATAARWQQLLDQKLVARQTAEEKFADAKVRKAALDSQTANVARLRQLQGFRRVTAPYAGTITARGVNVGQLVTAAGAVNAASSGTASALFRISSAGALRLFLAVPQAQAGLMKAGTTAQVSVPELPGKRYAARVVRNSGSIDPVSRSLRVELAVEDRSGNLLPGAYVQAAFEVEASADVLRLPVSTLIFRGKGTMVAVVTADSKVALRSVQLGRDFGTEYEVVDGLSATDRVILNPPDSLLEGQPVKAVSPEPKPAS
jgi:hypothetical protein